jgi:threonine dehydratase
VQQAIADGGVAISLVPEAAVRAALKELFEAQALVVEPSSAIALALVKARAGELEEPICVILTGETIAREDHRRQISVGRGASNAGSDSTQVADRPFAPCPASSAWGHQRPS